MNKINSLIGFASKNWQSGITVALISLPLSIALAIASGANPVAGLITGIWATFIASIFCGSNYNVIGAAGALSTVLFAATIAAPFGLGAEVLPIIAICVGLIILFTWVIGANRFLYYVPSSVMYGFAGGVAFLIAASQLFDATGLSMIKRTGTFIGDVSLYAVNAYRTDPAALVTFVAFLSMILIWKYYIKSIPAVIPISVVGILFGFYDRCCETRSYK